MMLKSYLEEFCWIFVQISQNFPDINNTLGPCEDHWISGMSFPSALLKRDPGIPEAHIQYLCAFV